MRNSPKLLTQHIDQSYCWLIDIVDMPNFLLPHAGHPLAYEELNSLRHVYRRSWHLDYSYLWFGVVQTPSATPLVAP
jgi:hypothetical protein